MGKLTMTRRTFAKMTAATAAAVGIAGTGTALAESSASSTSTGEVKRIRSTCRGCGKMECGVWVYVQDGKVIRSEGDEAAFQSMGNHCSKGQASLQAAYHPDRLKYPMKRTNPKDSDDPGWQRITWDEAMGTIGSKFSELQSKYGNETYFSMAGTSRIWSMGPYAALKQCFVSPNAIQANEICKGPRFYATKLNDYNAYSWMEVVGRPRVYVQWGGASELSNYDDSCRTTVDVATRADFHILVDPRQTNLGKEADIWLPLRPGTDAAMGLG
ncbi:MAG: molybdopterin-dependent oxidoreductase [Senegalimassilia faecalis]